MTAPGTISFEATRSEALHAALWLLVYGPYDRAVAEWDATAKAAERLFRCWKRRGRPALVTITMMRGEAELLAQQLPVAPMIGGNREDPIQRHAGLVGNEVRWRLRRGRGRPRHSESRLRKRIDRKASMAKLPESTRQWIEARLRELAATKPKPPRRSLGRSSTFTRSASILGSENP